MRTHERETGIAYLAYLNRESNKRHHFYDEEMKQYILMQKGDPKAIPEADAIIRSNLTGHLSGNPVRNIKYLFVACVTITTRFAIEGGLDNETAYTSSDYYINRMDKLNSVDEVLKLHHEMFAYFTNKMAAIKKENVFSKPVLQCMDFIDLNLHQPIRLSHLCIYVGLSESYLSTLFKKETGLAVSDYILRRRIETAKNMLRYSEFTSAQISEILAFSSQSYFIRSFKKLEGMTPIEYQNSFFRHSLNAASERHLPDEPVSTDSV